MTASEHNSDYFGLEFSIDGKDWKSISKVAALGNSTNPHTYSLVDIDNPLDGNNYYRLKQVDIDGNHKTYGPINIVCINDINNYFFITYPNPSGTKFQVSLQNTDLIGESILFIYDSKGAEVHRVNLTIKSGVNSFFIDKELASGVYFLYITNNKTKTNIIKHEIIK